MLVAGCDVGSLTAKAVILHHGTCVSTSLMKVKASAGKSSVAVLEEACRRIDVKVTDLDHICNTGYGRFENPYSQANVSEISCHALGAFVTDPTIRTIVDVGGQDVKVISIDDQGRVQNFLMNEKCAAGTGRCLELLAKSIGLTVEALGTRGLRSRATQEITNKCSIFMELEVVNLFYQGLNVDDLVRAIHLAVARRIIQLMTPVGFRENLCVTGGVAKNAGLLAVLEELLSRTFTRLPFDSQLIGALGAAHFAAHPTPATA